MSDILGNLARNPENQHYEGRALDPGSTNSPNIFYLFAFLSLSFLLYGPDHAEMCLMAYANNKGADQPAHPRSMISTFIVRCLESVICILAISKVSSFKILASFCS